MNQSDFYLSPRVEMKILLIEDQAQIGGNIKRYLELEWFEVDLIGDGKEGLDKALSQVYELLIIDRMLPSMDGVTIAKKVREKKTGVPIIMTTAKGQLEDKGEWYDAGADDYLVKPFALEELLMRIKAILKRTELPTVYRFHDIEVLIDEQRVIKAGKEVKLPLKEFLLLEYVAQRLGQAVSRTDLIDYIRWGDSRENDSTLDVYIANLRKKLGKDVIETIKGFGYRIM